MKDDADSATIFVDLLGAFYSVFKHFVFKKNYEAIADTLFKWLCNNDIHRLPLFTLVMDGQPTDQKEDTHETRSIRHESKLQAAERLVPLILPKEGIPIKRISGAKWKSVKTKLKESFRMSSNDKQEIVGFLTAKGFTVHVARGEADVYIAQQSNAIVMSGDSDLLLHRKITAVIRPKFTNRSELYLDTMSIILKKTLINRLDLSNGIVRSCY